MRHHINHSLTVQQRQLRLAVDDLLVQELQSGGARPVLLDWADQYVSARAKCYAGYYEYVAPSLSPVPISSTFDWLTDPSLTALIWAWWSDAVELRWPPMLLAGVRVHCTLKLSRCSQSTADMEYVRRNRASCDTCVYAYRAAMGVVLYGASAGAIVLD